MKIIDLHVANFKAIDQVSLIGLSDVVVIAGANGSGKSTIFDAIRFWKSSIGSYQKRELQNWLNELGFGSDQSALLAAHQSRDEPFSINATVTLSQGEVDYLKEHGQALLAYYFYKNQSQSHMMAPQVLSVQNLELFDEFRAQKEGILSQAASAIPHLTSLSCDQPLNATVEVTVSGHINVNAPFVLQLILSIFVDGVGVIEHYGPQRTFGRERVESLNLSLETQIRSQRQNSALYNHSNKYGSVKAELASAYVKRLISESAGAPSEAGDSLERSISELFLQFIPGKTFEGIVPTQSGSLTFNVRTAAGLHDISDLSSGEKELIYGYLRLKNSGLKNSVVMIDEPELHLNSRLTDGLPDFYYRHIGRPLNNQLWLVTHSDTILRQSVGYEGFNVYHMKTVGNYGDNEDQLVPVSAESELNKAVIDLVGDLAAFKPGGKLVILEGGGEAEFDKSLLQRLFPEFAQKVNLISSESKTKVQALHGILEKLGAEQGLFSGVYSIVDADIAVPKLNQASHVAPSKFYSWDCYHIENYLLNSFFIRNVLIDNFIIDDSISEVTVVSWLKQAASSTKDTLVRHEVENLARRELTSCLKVSTDRSKPFVTDDLENLISSFATRISTLQSTTLSLHSLNSFKSTIENKLNASLQSDAWLSFFRGRDVLKAFVSARGRGRITYEVLRNQVSARMRDREFQPIGMGQVLALIEPPIP